MSEARQCQGCGRAVSVGAICECDVDLRIAVALERIASVLTTLRDRLVGDGRHTQELRVGPISHSHKITPGSVPEGLT